MADRRRNFESDRPTMSAHFGGCDPSGFAATIPQWNQSEHALT
jgi:hypothetical protein